MKNIIYMPVYLRNYLGDNYHKFKKNLDLLNSQYPGKEISNFKIDTTLLNNFLLKFLSSYSYKELITFNIIINNKYLSDNSLFSLSDYLRNQDIDEAYSTLTKFFVDTSLGELPIEDLVEIEPTEYFIIVVCKKGFFNSLLTNNKDFSLKLNNYIVKYLNETCEEKAVYRNSAFKSLNNVLYSKIKNKLL